MVQIFSEYLSELFIFTVGRVEWTFLACKPPDLCFMRLMPNKVVLFLNVLFLDWASDIWRPYWGSVLHQIIFQVGKAITNFSRV